MIWMLTITLLGMGLAAYTWYASKYRFEPGADLRNAKLDGVELPDTNLRDANLAGACLIDSSLAGSNFSGANLIGCDLTRANLKSTNLSGVDLTNACLTDANLSGANLENANLTYASLDGADLTNANLTGATLTGARLTDTLSEVPYSHVEAAFTVDGWGDLGNLTWNEAKLAGATMNCLLSCTDQLPFGFVCEPEPSCEAPGDRFRIVKKH